MLNASDSPATADGSDEIAMERAAELALHAYGLEPEHRPAILEADASSRGDDGATLTSRQRRLVARLAEWPVASPLQRAGETARAIATEVHGDTFTPPIEAWSIHPVAAAAIRSANPLGPRLADLGSTPQARRAEMREKAERAGARRATRATTTAEHGVVVLERALLSDRSGKPVALVRQVGPTIEAEFYGKWPESVAQALVGLTAGTLCNLFEADPRGARAVIESAENVADGARARLRVRFQDSLVPILASEPGGEDWRPTQSAGLVTRPRSALHTHQIRHAFAAMAAAHAGPEACVPMSASQPCGPWTPGPTPAGSGP